MYSSTLSDIDKKNYADFQERLKNENRSVKKVFYSKELRIGSYFADMVSTVKGKENVNSLIQRVRASLRWRKLCKKYPIRCLPHVEKNSDCNYFSDEKIVVYTAIFGNYDIPQEPIVVPDNCEFVLITDQKVPGKSAWKCIDPASIIPKYEELSNAEKNRFCKMFPHKVFPDVRYTIYIDGNIKVITDLTELVNHDLSSGLQFHKHKARNCVYEELEACSILGKASKDAIGAYRTVLQKRQFPAQYGMVECNVIVRDSKNSIMKDIMEEWWEEFHNHEVKRDQLSMPYLLWKHGIEVSSVSELGDNVEENDAIRVIGHL